MKLRMALAMSACGLLLTGVGCTSPSAITRAQSPDGMQQQFLSEVYGSQAEQVTPTSYPGGGQFVTDPYSYSGGEIIYEDPYGSGMMGPDQRRQARAISRGLLPPPGSPYYGQPYPTRSVTAQGAPVRTVGGVEIYDGQVASPVHAGDCPRCGHDLAPGGCPHCGADYVHWAPRHHHTFALRAPVNPVRPTPDAVGGAVVYPYYTHKGPSCFFMK